MNKIESWHRWKVGHLYFFFLDWDITILLVDTALVF